MLTTRPIVSHSFVLCGLCVLCFLGVLGDRPSAQNGAQNGDWRHYGGDAGSTKYSPLDRINRDNVKNLNIAWRWKADNSGPSPSSTSRRRRSPSTAFSTRRRAHAPVVAIDGATGETLWMYRYDEGARGQAAPRKNHRGVSYWTDGQGDERILYITPGYRLIALNAKTGTRSPPSATRAASTCSTSCYDAAPRRRYRRELTADDREMLRSSAVRSPRRRGATRNVPGHVRGYDVRTGKRLWTFHTIPRPGESGNETWENDSWSYTGNTAVWAPMSADQELGYVYLPVETPTNDSYGGHRPGNNLFAESLVCLDASTGKRIWHFQFVHHGIWDYDIPAPPILLDLTATGSRSKRWRRSPSRPSPMSSIARPAGRSGRSRSGRCRSRTCQARKPRRRSRSRPGRRRSIAKA